MSKKCKYRKFGLFRSGFWIIRIRFFEEKSFGRRQYNFWMKTNVWPRPRMTRKQNLAQEFFKEFNHCRTKQECRWNETEVPTKMRTTPHREWHQNENYIRTGVKSEREQRRNGIKMPLRTVRTDSCLSPFAFLVHLVLAHDYFTFKSYQY
jgi:hypothetical protein